MGIRSWWFYRGVQSALFYYISFAPCLKFAYSRRRNAEMKRAQRAARASQHASAHANDPEKALPTSGTNASDGTAPASAGTTELVKPIPYSANIYWTSDMEAGPSLPDGWRSKKVMNQRRKKRRLEMLKDLRRPTLNIVVNRESGLPRISVGVNSTALASGSGNGSTDVRSERTSKSERTVVPSPRIVVSDGAGGEVEIETLDDVASKEKDKDRDEHYGWNMKLYQRPSEGLWGLDDVETGSKRKRTNFEIDEKGYRDPSSLYSSHIPAPSRTGIMTLIDPKEPPIVKPAKMHTASEVLWMTQPPPSAKFMEGKARRDDTLSQSTSEGLARRLSRASENTATSTGSVRVVLLPVEEGLGARPEAEGQRHDRTELLPALDLRAKKVKRGRMKRMRRRDRERESSTESSASDSSASFDIPREENGYFDMHRISSPMVLATPKIKRDDGKEKGLGLFSDILSRVRDRQSGANETELRELDVNVAHLDTVKTMDRIGQDVKRQRWSMDI